MNQNATVEELNQPSPPLNQSAHPGHRFIESNYNPGLKVSVMERLFGYSRTTFLSWEKPDNNKGPSLKPIIKTNAKSAHLNQRTYSVTDVRAMWDYMRAEGEVPTPPTLPVHIAVWHNKGGVGKSVFSKELASMYSILMGYKVLLVDCDSQSDSTLLMNCLQNFKDLAGEDDRLQPTIRDVIGYTDINDNFNQVSLKDALIDLSPNLTVLPSDEDVHELDLDLTLLEGISEDERGGDDSKLASVKHFLEKLHTKYKYDIVIFDCAPNKGILNLNILYACDRLLIPVEIEAKCLHSIKRVVDFLKKMSTSVSSQFTFERIVAVPNKFDPIPTLHQKALINLKERKFSASILSSAVFPKATVVNIADTNQEPIFMLALDSTRSSSNLAAKRLTNSFWTLAHELLDITPHKVLFPEVISE